MNSYPGILIVFDGIDGAGKTTQVQLLEKALVDAGEVVVVSKEPTDGQWGAKLRASATTGRLPFDEELEAFINDRQDHLQTKIIPALEAGKVVILDRYFYSTIAYQGIRCGDDAIDDLEKKVRENVLIPDAAYFMEIPPTLAANRIDQRDGEANHFEALDDLIKIDHVFQIIADHDGAITRIDGAQSIRAIHEQIMARLIQGPFKEKRCAKDYGCHDTVYCSYRLTESCPWWQLVRKLQPTYPGILA